MSKFAKWIGGGLGWALGGPIGALIGFGLGAAVDNLKFDPDSEVKQITTPGDFAVSLLVLSAAVMKSDGRVLKSELGYVKKVFINQFGENRTRIYLQTLRDILEKDFNLNEVCNQIKYSMDYDSRVQLIHYLFGLAISDDNVNALEVSVINEIGTRIGLVKEDIKSVQSMFYKDISSAYSVLEISQDATVTEIKKAYRNMAVKFHPDKVAHLGDEFQKAAKEKFQKVNEAYETLKREKGFN
jgi:DnaJ like chaperone protein